MLVQIEQDDQKINVYIEQRKGKTLFNLSREDFEYIRVVVTKLMLVLLNKYCLMYGERRRSDVVV